jgi:hypothetical protein
MRPNPRAHLPSLDGERILRAAVRARGRVPEGHGARVADEVVADPDECDLTLVEGAPGVRA